VTAKPFPNIRNLAFFGMLNHPKPGKFPLVLKWVSENFFGSKNHIVPCDRGVNSPLYTYTFFPPTVSGDFLLLLTLLLLRYFRYFHYFSFAPPSCHTSQLVRAHSLPPPHPPPRYSPHKVPSEIYPLFCFSSTPLLSLGFPDHIKVIRVYTFF